MVKIISDDIKSQENEFNKWYINEATDDETALHSKLIDFMYLFDDMLFEEDSSTAQYFKFRYSTQSGRWIAAEYPVHEKLQNFSYYGYRAKIDILNGAEGYYDAEKSTICIDERSLDNDAVLLHQMIHLHEDILSEIPSYYRDLVFMKLYHRLRRKIAVIDDFLSLYSNILIQNGAGQTGEIHDLLFVMKGLDLDLRMGYDLGTVCGNKCRFEFET